MDPTKPSVLILVRHGETPANLEGVWHGWTDSPLTELGERQAARVAARLGRRGERPTAVYASDLTRTRRTAEAIATELVLAVRFDVGLREFHLGAWEGRTFRELDEEERLWHHWRTDPHYAPHGGESPREVTTRVVDALRRIAAGHPGEHVVVVTHGGALSMALGELLDRNYASWRRLTSNCSVSELVLDPEPSLLLFNDTTHLDEL
jgi:probable phosphoglycerate mutase